MSNKLLFCRRTTTGICLGLLLAGGGCTSVQTPPSAAELKRFEYNQPQMGVPFRLVLYAPDEATAQKAGAAAFSRIRQLNDILTDYDMDSELNRLCHGPFPGQPVKVSPDLWLLLERSQKLAARTGGAFDVTVGPYVNLWRRARRWQQLPNPELLAEARQRVGYQKLRLNPRARTVELLAADMRLDLGAIAKGYAADEGLKILRAQGITRALVSGAGDMALGDPPPGKSGWRIEIAPINATNAPPPRLAVLANCGVATSGDLFQFLEIDGKRYSHIVDPRTGIGLTDHSLVTVIARDCTTADSLSTAVSVLGPEDGLKLVEKTRGAVACIMRKPADTIEARESKGFQSRLVP